MQESKLKKTQEEVGTLIGPAVKMEGPLESFVRVSLGIKGLGTLKKELKADAMTEYDQVAPTVPKVVVLGHTVSKSSASKPMNVSATIRAIAKKSGYGDDWEQFVKDLARLHKTVPRYTEREESLRVN